MSQDGIGRLGDALEVTTLTLTLTLTLTPTPTLTLTLTLILTLTLTLTHDSKVNKTITRLNVSGNSIDDAGN